MERFWKCGDGYPNLHYTMVAAGFIVDLRGHLLVCSYDGGCHSQLRVLRVAGTRYSVLGNFYHYVNDVISSHLRVRDIDMSLLSGDLELLMKSTMLTLCWAIVWNPATSSALVFTLQTQSLDILISNQSLW